MKKVLGWLLIAASLSGAAPNAFAMVTSSKVVSLSAKDNFTVPIAKENHVTALSRAGYPGEGTHLGFPTECVSSHLGVSCAQNPWVGPYWFADDPRVQQSPPYEVTFYGDLNCVKFRQGSTAQFQCYRSGYQDIILEMLPEMTADLKYVAVSDDELCAFRKGNISCWKNDYWEHPKSFVKNPNREAIFAELFAGFKPVDFAVFGLADEDSINGCGVDGSGIVRCGQVVNGKRVPSSWKKIEVRLSQARLMNSYFRWNGGICGVTKQGLACWQKVLNSSKRPDIKITFLPEFNETTDVVFAAGDPREGSEKPICGVTNGHISCFHIDDGRSLPTPQELIGKRIKQIGTSYTPGSSVSQGKSQFCVTYESEFGAWDGYRCWSYMKDGSIAKERELFPPEPGPSEFSNLGMLDMQHFGFAKVFSLFERAKRPADLSSVRDAYNLARGYCVSNSTPKPGVVKLSVPFWEEPKTNKPKAFLILVQLKDGIWPNYFDRINWFGCGSGSSRDKNCIEDNQWLVERELGKDMAAISNLTETRSDRGIVVNYLTHKEIHVQFELRETDEYLVSLETVRNINTPDVEHTIGCWFFK